MEKKLWKSDKSPSEFVIDLSEYIREYTYSERIISFVRYSFTGILKEIKDDDEALKLINKLIKNTENAPASVRGEIYRASADVLFDKGLFKDSTELAQKAIDLFDDNEHLSFKEKQHELTMAEMVAKKPDYKTRPFDRERLRGYYVGTKTDVYNLLGESLAQQGKSVAAEKAFRNSYAIKTNKDASLGIARAAEKNGKNEEALKFAATAVLTGKAEPSEVEYFRSLYAKQHQGKTTGAEDYLDTAYKKTYKNPVKGEKYKPTSKRTTRVVLAELFTGAGCIPCIPIDYTLETALDDYSPKEIAILVYHWHAPTWDPLGNYSSDSRVNYYDVKGAPTIFFDGKKSDKAGDYFGSDGEEDEIQEIAKGINEEIRQNLEVPSQADLILKARRNGQLIKAEVVAEKFKNVSNDVSLQIALVENEVTYSGENGLRFHPMVVRALAGDNDKRNYGFKIDPSKSNKIEYVFDVDKIVARNADYYKTFPMEKMSEFSERYGGKVPESLKVEFKFKKNQINAEHLSVIAFLQDNKSKKILQTSWVNLASK